MTLSQQSHSLCCNIILARHFARVYGLNEAAAIKRAARKARDETKDHKVYELCKLYPGELQAATVDGKRLTGDEMRVYSVQRLEDDMRKEGVL